MRIGNLCQKLHSTVQHEFNLITTAKVTAVIILSLYLYLKYIVSNYKNANVY